MDSHKIRKVLAVGVDAAFLERLESRLEAANFDLDVLRSLDSALMIAESVAVDILICGCPQDDDVLASFVQRIRAPLSPCRRSAVLIVSDRKREAEVAKLEDDGYLRCVWTDASDSDLDEQVAALTRFAPRLTVRIPIKLEVHLGGSKTIVLSQTENVSLGGMLVRIWRSPEDNAHLAFELFIPGSPSPVRGHGLVVRQTRDSQGNPRGVGMKFEDFEDDGREVLMGYLSQTKLSDSAG